MEKISPSKLQKTAKKLNKQNNNQENKNNSSKKPPSQNQTLSTIKKLIENFAKT